MTTTVSRSLLKLTSFKSYGAVGDGVTDDRDAVIAAIEDATDNGLKIVNEPGEVFFIDGNLTFSDREIYIEGGTFLFATNRGMDITLSDPFVYVNMRDVTFQTQGESNATALKVTNTAVLNANRTTFPRVVLENIRIGTPTTFPALNGTFLGGVHLVDIDTPTIRDLQVRGLRNDNFDNEDEDHWYRTDSFGLFLESPDDIQPTLTNIYGLDCKHVRTALKVRGNMEGILLVGGSLIQVGTGCSIDWTGTEAINPGFQTYGTHINATRQCFDLYGVYDFTISGGHFYRFNQPDGIGFTALRMDNCSRGSIIGGQWTGMNDAGSPGAVLLGEWTNCFLIDFKGSARKFDQNINLIGSSCRDNIIKLKNESDVAPVFYSSGASAADQLEGEGSSNVNNSVVNISGLTSVVSTQVDVNNGQVVDVYAEFHIETGGSSGTVTVSVLDGSANTRFLTGTNGVYTFPNAPANSDIRGTIHCRCKVDPDAPSTLTFLMNANAPSGSSIAAGNAGIRVVRY